MMIVITTVYVNSVIETEKQTVNDTTIMTMQGKSLEIFKIIILGWKITSDVLQSSSQNSPTLLSFMPAKCWMAPEIPPAM